MDKETTLIFTGDIGFDKYMDKKWEDDALLDPSVLAFLHSGDHLIVNVEGPLSEGGKQLLPNGVEKLMHTQNPDSVKFLKKIKADIWNICNNHICDAGAKGIEDTLKEAKKAGAKTLGAGMNIDEASVPLILNEAGGIGLISVGYQRACRKASADTPGCFSWSDMDLIREKIAKIKSTCRHCIVVAHGGEEFTALPSPYVRDRYKAYLDMGADIVVSHHPHVPMNYETFGDKIIFYSLGNFVFDTDYQRSQFNTEYGIFIKLRFTEEGFSFEPFGIKIDRETEHIVPNPLPKIFTDVNESEYKLLAPLAAKMFIENTKRQLKFLKPAEFEKASEEDFIKNFYEPLRSGRVPGEVLDFQLVYPLSKEESKKEWKKSSLKDVVDFMLKELSEDLQ